MSKINDAKGKESINKRMKAFPVYKKIKLKQKIIANRIGNEIHQVLNLRKYKFPEGYFR
jgi:hypothetical protein